MKSNHANSNVFLSLVKPIRDALAELGFAEPTLPQAKAIPHVLAGENVLLIAPTGSGKTEAVLLPIFSKLIQQEKKRGISIVYITPLRALNRDLLKRLSFWVQRLGLTVEVRHGDTEMKLRRRQAISPPQMLVTTPETLQAILPGARMRQHLSCVRHVVVDEVHELASSKRGVQLSIALERLFDVVGEEFQRVGLSATVGNPEEVAQFIAGAGREVRIVEALPPKGYSYNVESPLPTDADYELAGKLRTSPEAAARIRRVLELVDSHRSTLIFVNSRTNAEMLGHKFGQLGRADIAVHHGSLSKEERVQIEDDFKAGVLKAIICTSTLELGIDIGNVDLVVQYLSPRQVSSLIQRVGRSGHRLDMLSEGVIVTAFPDDTLESTAAVRNAYANRVEPVLIHEGALDVLAHQVVGLLMDKGVLTTKEVLATVRKAYPYRNLKEETLLDVIDFLDSLDELRFDREGKVLRRARKSRRYYFENLSMIPDEKRYPIINVISDRKIGTLGDEFMALRARVGLNFIVRGKVWRIVQIEDETGTVYVVPAEDPFAAIPGWDGEILPVPFELAQETGKLREVIRDALRESDKAEAVAEKLAGKLKVEKTALLDAAREVAEHLKQGAPLPTNNHILVEAFDKYLIVHASFGEIVNRTLGSIFDSVLSDKELIVGWWNDGYRILVEMPRSLAQRDVEKMPALLFGLSDEEVDKAFSDYLEVRFPFSYKMKFVAERFGALPRGKTMGPEQQGQLVGQFKDTPVYDETLREALLEKVNVAKVKEIMHNIKDGNVKVSTVWRSEKPTPLAYRILAMYSDISELMAPEEVLLSNIDKMKKAIEARTAKLLCISCGEWTGEKKIRSLPEKPACEKCGSELLALLYPSQDAKRLREILKKRREDKELAEEELKELRDARRTADLVLSYGKKAIVALEVKGVGPETAFRILGKMHMKEDEFYMDLLKAKIQYLRTREYWEDRQEKQ
ncbi:MAG: DEAD/DEAH box helicase [Candidatus Bathyarchaeota archaeon]|jgi:ATP-dependent Lhr-like helicase|nr:DEAD/DEAH box helicase [Candidatus Bathyarchaeota archaeon A05DMB-5]MDH7558547.1 DEAD/DEAH box helicase [Candidatus Bathyarchaeota archaeon]